MTTDLLVLSSNAAAVGLIHTAIGPDHYLPFIVMARARRWSAARTVAITLACGLGHVASSVVLGLVGYGFGASVGHLEWIESVRGEFAAWALIVFGVLYAAWGGWRLRRGAGAGHSHDHLLRLHSADHVHHPRTGEEVNITPWILFAIFVFGPCEPLIPLFIYPAATGGWAGAGFVSLAFSVATIACMVVIVLAVHLGLARLPEGKLGRYAHVLAGGTIALSGLAIQVLGL